MLIAIYIALYYLPGMALTLRALMSDKGPGIDNTLEALCFFFVTSTLWLPVCLVFGYIEAWNEQ